MSPCDWVRLCGVHRIWDNVYGTTQSRADFMMCLILNLWAGAFLLKVDHVALYRVSLWLHPSPCHVIVDIYNVITIIGGILDFLVRVWWLDVDPHRGVQRPNKVSINQFDCVLPHLLDPYAPCPPKAEEAEWGSRANPSQHIASSDHTYMVSNNDIYSQVL